MSREGRKSSAATSFATSCRGSQLTEAAVSLVKQIGPFNVCWAGEGAVSCASANRRLLFPVVGNTSSCYFVVMELRRMATSYAAGN